MKLSLRLTEITLRLMKITLRLMKSDATYFLPVPPQDVQSPVKLHTLHFDNPL